jgi:hypothetical protein
LVINSLKVEARGGTEVDEVVFVTPLFQTNFLPDLTQVKVLFPATDLMPTLVHLAPALVAAFAGISGSNTKRESIDKIAISLLFIYKG